MKKKLLHYYVITPEFGHVVPVLDFGQGPIEYECDVIEIEAENKRDAISLGVREMLKDKSFRWCRDSRRDGESPYAGVRVELP
jgi:hypothetical protein